MSGTVVLVYHRVADPAADPLDLSIAPERFAAHVEHLARHHEVVPLAAARDAGTGPRVAITFDDGYADNLEVAAPVLAEHGLPATFFVAAQVLDGRELWWDALAHLLLDDGVERPPFLDVEVAGRPLRVDLRTAEGRTRANRAIGRRVRVRPPEEIAALLESVGAQCRVDEPAACAAHRLLDAAGVRALSAVPGMTIGSHTVHHTAVTAVQGAARRLELDESRRRLAAATGQPVDHFAFPYGNPGTFDRGSERAVADAGYALACRNIPGVVRRRTHPMRLPRCQVYDWSASELAARIDAWHAGRAA